MNINTMTRAQLVAKTERDAEAVQRAERLIAENERLKNDNGKLKEKLDGHKRVVTKTVPKPTACPKQAEKVKSLKRDLAKTRTEAKELANEIADQRQHIAQLQSRLDKFAQYDMDEFEKWTKMRAVAMQRAV